MRRAACTEAERLACVHRELVSSYLMPKMEGALSLACHFAVIISHLPTIGRACGLSGLPLVRELSLRCLLNLTR
jgi:hypothetical protein